MDLMLWQEAARDSGNTFNELQKVVGDGKQAYVLAFIGLAGSLVPVVLSWTKDIGVTSQRVKLLDEGVKRIAFWEQWLKLSIEIGEDAADSARKRVKQELDLLCTALSTSSAQFHIEASALQELKSQFKSKLASLSWIRRALLFYRPPRPLAWFPRFFFYLFALFTGFGVLFELIAYFDRATQNRSSVLGAFLASSIFTAFVTVCFRYLSISLEKPHKQMTDAAPDLPAIPTP